MGPTPLTSWHWGSRSCSGSGDGHAWPRTLSNLQLQAWSAQKMLDLSPARAQIFGTGMGPMLRLPLQRGAGGAVGSVQALQRGEDGDTLGPPFLGLPPLLVACLAAAIPPLLSVPPLLQPSLLPPRAAHFRAWLLSLHTHPPSPRSPSASILCTSLACG